MRRLLITTVFVAASASVAFAASKTYQVTGPVLALTDSTITVQKGSEKWDLQRDANTKLPATVKVGSKITAQYTMTATSIEDKGPAAAATSAKK